MIHERWFTTVLEKGLKKNFEDVKVCVSECPDLTQDPFNFPVKGMNSIC